MDKKITWVDPPPQAVDTKLDRVEKLVKLLTRVFKRQRLPVDSEFAEALMMFAAAVLEGRVDRRGFIEKCLAWWDITVSTQLDESQRRGPDLPTMEQAAREMAQDVRCMAPAGAGFALVVYNFGPNGEVTFVSTGDRNDTIGMLDTLVQILKHEREQTPDGAVRS